MPPRVRRNRNIPIIVVSSPSAPIVIAVELPGGVIGGIVGVMEIKGETVGIVVIIGSRVGVGVNG